MSSFMGASKTSKILKNWLVSSLDADGDAANDLSTLRLRSRDLARNNGLASGVLTTKVNNVIGSGLSLQSRVDRDFLRLSDTDGDALETAIEREWNFWAAKNNFSLIQRLVYRSMLLNGDVFVLLVEKEANPYTLGIEIIEADRVCNKNGVRNSLSLVDGIVKDSLGRPEKIQIVTPHPGTLISSARSWTEYPIYGSVSKGKKVLHIFEPLRPGQTRGLPVFTPVLELFKQMAKYIDAEMTAALVSACFTVFLTSPEGDGFLPTVAGDGVDDVELGPASIVALEKGEDIKIANPSRPNEKFAGFIDAIMQQIGTGVGIPLEVLRQSYTASYSASRAAILEAWKGFSEQRSFFVDAFCVPIYEIWFEEAVARDKIKVPNGFQTDPISKFACLGCEFVGPAPSSLDPLKEVKASQLKVENEFSTRSQEAAALGYDWMKVHKQRKKEEFLRTQDKTKIESEENSGGV